MVFDRKSIPIVAWVGEKEANMMAVVKTIKTDKITQRSSHLVSVVKAVVHEPGDERGLPHYSNKNRQRY